MRLREGAWVAAAVFALAAPAAIASFSGDGYETLDFGGSDSPDAIAVQKDGKIVLGGGTTATPTAFDFAVARFTKDGDVDSGFGDSGGQKTDFGDFDSIAGIAMQGRRIVAAGVTNVGDPDEKVAVARYTAGGEPDPSFSQDGVVTVGMPTRVSGQDLAVRGGRIVVAANARENFAAVVLNAKGRLDRRFSGDGKVVTNMGGHDGVTSVAIDGNGRIVLAGNVCKGLMCKDGSHTALARYTPDGKLDRSFSGDGKLIARLSAGDGARDLAIQDDGKLVIAGHRSDPGSDFMAARFTPSGRRDRSFSRDGKIFVNFGAGELADGLAIARNGRIVLVGSTQVNPNVDAALVALTPRGRLDKKFSGDGKQTTDIGNVGNTWVAVAFQSRRKFVVAGTIPTEFVVARYRANGELDD